MTKQEFGEFGEPWESVKCSNGIENLSDRDGFVIGTENIGGGWQPQDVPAWFESRQLHRAIACVNALNGLDPAKVRALIDELAEKQKEKPEEYDGSNSGDIQNYGWDMSDYGWANKARACFTQEPEQVPEIFPGTMDALDKLGIRKEGEDAK